jgi:hypothetical protein
MLLLYPFLVALSWPHWQEPYVKKSVLIDNRFWMIELLCPYCLFYTLYFHENLIFFVTQAIQFGR